MTRTSRASLALTAACATALTSAALLRAQGRGGGEWTTSGFDAQRTAWVRNDARLTKKAVEKGEFKFLWKAKFDNEARQLNSLTEPVLLDLLIGYRGFKTLAFVGGSADRVFAIDTDLARPYWTANLNYAASTGGPPPSSWECPGGLMATPSRRTALAPSNFGGGFGGGGRRMSSTVGEPGKGAAVLSQTPPAPRPPTPPPTPPPQPRTGDAAAPAARAASAVAPIPFGGVDPLYTMGSDGLLRTLRVSDGAETMPPMPFLPPSAKPSALIFVDGFVYTTTSNGCGTAPNAVWAIDLTTQEKDKRVVSWKTSGANVVGNAGPTFGTNGTLYVALGSAPSSANAAPAAAAASQSNAVVALDRHALTVKDWFTTEGTAFATSPIVIRYKDKDLIAAAASDGRLYLLDSASLGGADHKMPLFVTPAGAATGSALATWDDGTTRWVLAAAANSVVAFKLVDAGGKLSLESAWKSRDLVSPLAPIVVNGLVMAASSGEFHAEASTPAAARAQKSTPAVLYVLDATSGKELWSSGTTITSFARAGLSAGGGQVYLVTYDNQLYAFGIPMEH